MRQLQFIVVVAIAMLSASQSFASACTDDDWQPTFVHDLDNEDGPYYVASGGTNFLKLNWIQNGGYYPHACELVRGPNDVRDRRGFTTCREYTRIQCGCSRTIRGNSTCATFLSWHPATPAVPARTPRPMTPVSVTLTPAHWQQAPQYTAPVGSNTAGLVLQGGAWTNGRLQNGSYDGNHVYSKEVFTFSDGGDAYMRFAVNGGGKYLGVWPRVIEGVAVKPLTTDHSWAGSVVIPANTWIFAHLHVEPSGDYRIVVALDNYDDEGGRAIYQNDARFVYPRGRLELQFADNYAGPAASITIGDARVVASSSALVMSPMPAPPMPAPPPRPAPPAAASGGPGAACSTNADCVNSVCLLGVCAGSSSSPRRF